jgi:hypothetical protein
MSPVIYSAYVVRLNLNKSAELFLFILSQLPLLIFIYQKLSFLPLNGFYKCKNILGLCLKMTIIIECRFRWVKYEQKKT